MPEIDAAHDAVYGSPWQTVNDQKETPMHTETINRMKIDQNDDRSGVDIHYGGNRRKT